MVLDQKWLFFQTFFFFGNIGQENFFNDILEQKKAFPGYRKMIIFHNLFFLGKIAQENVFDDILQRKNSFLG